MAQTARTLAEIIALLPDNTEGLIDPVDIRDMLVSLVPVHGTMHRDVSAATDIDTPGTYVKGACQTAAGQLHDMTMPADNRLQYIGVPERHFHFIATISLICGGINQVIGVKFAKNGAVIDASVSRRKIGTGTDIGALTIQAEVNMVTNDYIELWVTNETSTNSVTLVEFLVHLTGTMD